MHKKISLDDLAERREYIFSHPDFPSKDYLQRLIDEGKTDAQIGKIMRKGSRFVSMCRKAHGLSRMRVAGAIQARRRGFLDLRQMFISDAEKERIMRLVRAGDWTLHDLEAYAACTKYEAEFSYYTWLKENRGAAVEPPQMRRAREVLLDPFATSIDKVGVVLGRRFRQRSTGAFELDGKTATIEQCIDEANDDCRDLGLPLIYIKSHG